MGLAGVGRPLSLFKGLPQKGYDCDVLTVKPVTYWAYEPELLDGLDLQRVFRSGSHDPQRLMYLLGIRKIKQSVAGTTRKATNRFFPDSKTGWVRAAVRLGRTLVENYRYDAILSTSPPISSHLVARTLAREFSVPWVADFRDFWTSHRIEDTYDKPRLVRKGKRLLEEIVNEATAITGVTGAVIDYLGSGTVISNGYDERAEDWRQSPDKKRFVIGLPGNVDSAESIRPLLALLSQLRDDAQAVFDHTVILQLGAVDSEWFLSLLKEYDLENHCEILGYQPRKRCIETLARASMFYIGLSGRLDPQTVPSRIFELLASGRPLLAHAPADSAPARLVELAGAGLRFDDSSCAEALDYLRLHITDFAAGRQQISALPEFARQYSAEAMVEKFVSVLDELR